MDLIAQYSSSFSDEDEEDETHQSKTAAGIQLKEIENKDDDDRRMNESANVILLMGPSIDKKMFQRSRSHVQGMS